MQKRVHRILAAIFSVPLFSLLLLPLAEAETMSSANFKVQNDVLNMAGGQSSSGSYKANDALGDLATGSDASSANYNSCAGYECFQGASYISFSLKEGLAAPGAAGANVALGTLSPVAVTTSNGATVNSVFVTAETNARTGLNVTVVDSNAGLHSTIASYTINSATATLAAGMQGFGLCVFSNTQDGQSPTPFGKTAPFAGTCTKIAGHDVGGLTAGAQTILGSVGQLKGGSAEVLVKASMSPATASATDYSDSITFIATGFF